MDQELMATKIAAILYSSPFRYLVSSLSLLDESAVEELVKLIDDSMIRETLGSDTLRPDMGPQDKVSLYIVARFIRGLPDEKLSEKIRGAFRDKLLRRGDLLKLISGPVDITGFIIEGPASKIIFRHPADLTEVDLTEEMRKLAHNIDKLRESIDFFCDKLVKAISGARGEEYQVLWRIIPSAFVSSIKKAYGDLTDELTSKLTLIPADPRSPHVTALDHMYSILPFVLDDEQLGIISWEVSNKQNFISTSRIPRDFWAGSYLISFLTFHVLKSLADEIGPDSVIKPFLYSSSLYDTYLRSTLRRGGISDDEAAEILIPSIPGAGIVLVPGSKVEYYVERIKELYEEAWSSLAELFWKALEEDLKDFKGDGIIQLRLDFVEKQKGEMPFDVAIAHLKTPISNDIGEDLLRELLEKGALSDREIEEFNRIKKLMKDAEGVHSLFMYLSIFLKALSSIHYSFTRTRVDGRVLEAPIRVERREDLCNICWRREAIIGTKRFEDLDGEGRDKLRKYLNELHERGIIIRDGERICFHCLLRRRLRNLIGRILESVGIRIRYEKIDTYPSTETIAGAPFAYTLLSILASPEGLDEKELNSWIDNLNKLKEIFSSIYGTSKSRLVESSSYKLLRERTKELKAADVLDGYLTALYKEHYFRAEKFDELKENAKEALDLLDQIMRGTSGVCYPLSILRGLENSPLAWLGVRKILTEGMDGTRTCIVRSLSDYFAIVKSDGDSMRDLFEASGIHQKRIIDMIPLQVLKGGYLPAESDILLSRWLPGMSYSLMLSRALTILSIDVAKLIEGRGGLAVYSGGDDVLAMIPAEISVQTVLSARERFSRSIMEVKDPLAEEILGEEKISCRFPGLGRRTTQSSSIIIVDAFFPLRRAVEMASNFVEEKAKAVRYSSGEKDCLHIVYRGREGFIPINLIGVEELRELLLELALGSSIGSGSWGFIALNGHVKPVRGFSKDVLEVNTDLSSDEYYNLYEFSAKRAGVDTELLRKLAPLREISVVTPRGRSCLLSEVLKGASALLGAFRESRPFVLGEEV
jgi:CRISPR-associated protein Cas10/Cmr2 subtype III-B